VSASRRDKRSMRMPKQPMPGVEEAIKARREVEEILGAARRALLESGVVKIENGVVKLGNGGPGAPIVGVAAGIPGAQPREERPHPTGGETGAEPPRLERPSDSGSAAQAANPAKPPVPGSGSALGGTGLANLLLMLVFALWWLAATRTGAGQSGTDGVRLGPPKGGLTYDWSQEDQPPSEGPGQLSETPPLAPPSEGPGQLSETRPLAPPYQRGERARCTRGGEGARRSLTCGCSSRQARTSGVGVSPAWNRRGFQLTSGNTDRWAGICPRKSKPNVSPAGVSGSRRSRSAENCPRKSKPRASVRPPRPPPPQA
jgi:hypothetical protein